MKTIKLKNTIAVLALALSVSFSAACSPAAPASTTAGQSNTTTTATEATTAMTTEAAITGALRTEDLSIEADGQITEILGDAGGLIEFLGEPSSYSAAPSCLFEGEDKTFEFEDLFIYTVPDKDTDLLDGYDLVTDRFQTRRGIAVGATREDVLDTYGEPFDQEYDLIYITDPDLEGASPRITFVLDGDTVIAISVYSGSNAAS